MKLPVLFGFIAATICFGAARIHASGSIATTPDKQIELPAFATRIVDFKPDTFQPSAFADWADQPGH